MTTQNEYLVGDLIELTTGAGFQNASGAAVDPTTLTLTVAIEGATPVIAWVWNGAGSIVHASTGNFTANVDSTLWYPAGKPLLSAVYWYKWVGTGTAQTLMQNWFRLTAPNV